MRGMRGMRGIFSYYVILLIERYMKKRWTKSAPASPASPHSMNPAPQSNPLQVKGKGEIDSPDRIHQIQAFTTVASLYNFTRRSYLPNVSFIAIRTSNLKLE
jgi:hypothetical protein